MNDDREHLETEEETDRQAPCCDGGACCPSGSGGGSQTWKTVAFVLIVIGAGVVLANSLMRNSRAAKPAPGFATTQVEDGPDGSAPAKYPVTTKTPGNTEDPMTAPALWRTELDTLASLNQLAMEADAVFVFLSTQEQQDSETITGQIEAAAQTIQSKGTQVAAFKLKHSAPEYAQFAEQISVPCVLALVKGGGLQPVAGEISEARLLQAFVTASRPASGCCPPGSTSCCPEE